MSCVGPRTSPGITKLDWCAKNFALAHLLHLLSEGLDGGILLGDHQLALLEVGFEGANDRSILLGHLLIVGVEGVNEGVLLFNLLVSPLSKGVSE